MIGVRLTALSELLARMSGRKAALRQTIMRVVNSVGQGAVRTLRQEYRTRHSATSTGVRTGALRRAYTAKVRDDRGNITLDLGILRDTGTAAAVLKYAAVHEKDGVTVIRPKNAGALTLPIPDSPALTPAGVARGGPRDWVGLFRVPGTNVLAVNAFKGPNHGRGGLLFLFSLHQQVTVPGRPALKPMQPRTREELVRRLGPESVRTLRGD